MPILTRLLYLGEVDLKDSPMGREVLANYYGRQNVCKLAALLDQAGEVIAVGVSGVWALPQATTLAPSRAYCSHLSC